MLVVQDVRERYAMLDAWGSRDPREQEIVNFNPDAESVVVNPLIDKVGSPRLFVHGTCSCEGE